MNAQEKTLILDLDGTVTEDSTWKIFNETLGITPEQDLKLFNEYKNGSLPYLEWTNELINIYKATGTQVTKNKLIETAKEIDFFPDAINFVKTAKEKGYKVILVSGSVDIFVETIANRLKTDSWLSCSKAVFENETLVDIVSMGDEASAKAKLVSEAGINLSEDTISVGDGGNEQELFKLTTGILVGNNKQLAPLAKHSADNLTDVLELI